MDILHRHITERILEALSDTPVILLHGARQTGKSTLAQWVASEKHPARYLTFDNATVLAAARRDPEGFLADIGSPAVLDEVQRAPELFLAIKGVVDNNRIPGRFLLTGSANVLLLPQLSESLAGRMEILTLWPFSQGELETFQEGLVDMLFADAKFALPVDLDRADIIQRVLVGGYPESVKRTTAKRRMLWFESYVSTIVQRQVRDLANIEYLTEIPRLLRLLAARVGTLINVAEISSTLGLPQTTVNRYLALLEMMYLVHFLPAWSAHLGKRLVKKAKVFLNDTGLVAYLTGMDQKKIQRDPTQFGFLLENFVVMELRKQIGWCATPVQLFHFRTRKGQEVNIVLEDSAGRLVGIEVKAASTVSEGDFKGMQHLRSLGGDRFHRGVVFYMGRESIPFGGNFYALPIGALWRTGR
jgi:predicted AAA+ superfamily ATPase